MIEKVLSFIEEHHMIKQYDHIIAGVSGGADSVCLLRILALLRQEIDFKLTVVHVEHGIRGEDSSKDAAFVKEICGKMDLSLKIYHCRARAYAKRKGLTLEEAARDLRYGFFREAAGQSGGNKIAVAHNQNDVAETMLFYLMRGTGLRGLGGILPVRNEIIRPLLCISRAEIEDYLKQMKQDFCVDRTNFEMDYTRNKIRGQILPAMEMINQKTVAHMYKTAEIAASAMEFIDWSVMRALKKHTVKTETAIEVKQSLLQEQHIIQQMAVMELIAAMTKNRKDITEIHVRNVLELFKKQIGKQLDLPNQMAAKRTYRGICFYLNTEDDKTKANEISKKIKYILKEDSVIKIPEFGYNISTELMQNIDEFFKISKKAYTKWFDYDKIKSNVQIRTRQSGDYLVIDKAGRKQKLKNYFINEKIPEDYRDQILLLADQDHILWIIGYRISEAFKVTEFTKRILKVQVNRGGTHEG